MIYLRDLSELPLSDVLPALGVHEHNYFPSLRQIRERAGHHPLTLDEQAKAQWFDIRNLKPKDFLEMPLEDFHPLTWKTIRSMGGRGTHPQNFGNWNSLDEFKKENEFLGRWKSFALGELKEKGSELLRDQAQATFDFIRNHLKSMPGGLSPGIVSNPIELPEKGDS